MIAARAVAVAVAPLLFLAACAAEEERLPPPSPSTFADRAVALWEGDDYTAGGDGTYGIDGANVVLSTLRKMGYDVPATTADGLYNNYRTVGGVDHTVWLTRSNGVADLDLSNADYSGLTKGDLVFLDYDLDYVWDHVVVYLGAYGAIAHAALNASDYYDQVVVSDMDDVSDPFQGDLQYSNVSSKELDAERIAELQ